MSDPTVEYDDCGSVAYRPLGEGAGEWITIDKEQHQAITTEIQLSGAEIRRGYRGELAPRWMLGALHDEANAQRRRSEETAAAQLKAIENLHSTLTAAELRLAAVTQERNNAVGIAREAVGEMEEDGEILTPRMSTVVNLRARLAEIVGEGAEQNVVRPRRL